MATRQQMITRIRNQGETGVAVERDLLQTLGFTAYVVNGQTRGWVDPVSGFVRLVGRFTTDPAAARLLLLNDADAPAEATATEICVAALNTRA